METLGLLKLDARDGYESPRARTHFAFVGGAEATFGPPLLEVGFSFLAVEKGGIAGLRAEAAIGFFVWVVVLAIGMTKGVMRDSPDLLGSSGFEYGVSAFLRDTVRFGPMACVDAAQDSEWWFWTGAAVSKV